MTHQEIRNKFLTFFKGRGHKVVPSSSLLPDDPSVLFTTAGMQQFKPYYTGEADPLKDFGSLNTISVQKCIRTSDIDKVGDESHNTFFEMLGNFSFGGYWKKEAIEYAHEFITKELGLKISYVSVFGGSGVISKDEESKTIWHSLGVSNIREEGMKDVFWGPTGNSGPCGPTTEIYCRSIGGQDVEVWNLVFNEFFCNGSREELLSGKIKLLPLAKHGVDTGMGLERLAIVVQKKSNLFETDLFAPIIGEIRGKNLYDYEKNARTERIIADHLRAAVFLIADGVRPSNVEQGYILRRLLRRAIRYAKLLGLPQDVYQRVVHVIVHDIYGGICPELAKKQDEILEVIEIEKTKFGKTLKFGLEKFDELVEQMGNEGRYKISGTESFNLYSTFGFPIELIEELAKERGLSVDVEDFQKELESHKAKSREGAEKKFGGHGLLLDTGELKAGNEEELKKATRLHTATHLLHASLRKILGSEVKQAGSDITAKRLRFDFTFNRRITEEERKKNEVMVNEVIKQDLPVTKKEMPYEEAIKSGALAFFKLKYPPMVNVYAIGPDDAPFSRELCGGPHVTRTSEIGKFKILKEEAVASGVRRIRATVE